MLNAVKKSAQKSVMTVTSWYRIPERGMNRFEVLAMSSCLPLLANRQYEYKYHFVCPFHVIAPYLFKSYFPESEHPWLQYVTEDNVIATVEFRDEAGNVTNRVGVNGKAIAHDYRDLCCLHLHKEEESIQSLKLYGMDPTNVPLTKQEEKNPDTDLPNNVDEIDQFIAKSINRTSPISFEGHQRYGFDLSNSNPLSSDSLRVLRDKDKPYNSIYACEVTEELIKRGEPLLLSGYRRQVMTDLTERDVSLMVPTTASGKALKSRDGRTMVMTKDDIPAGMIGGGVFDVNGMCKGMIEGVVLRPGATINGHVVHDTHAQHMYENCTAVVDMTVLSDFVGNVELGLLDDMQDEVKRMRAEMGEEAIREEQSKKMKPILEVIKGMN